ncbi:MAG: ribose-phosphate pyrophosphokinase [Armatimonadetes bacterium]|nr:ribose-phosphate pyrophosphokinase [Armatimonadota bacterium]
MNSVLLAGSEIPGGEFLKERPDAEHVKQFRLFTGNANPELANEIADYLDVRIGSALVSRFMNQEIQVRIEENVRGAEVFVIQPTCTPVNDNLMELLIMIDALKRASVRTVTAVIPYYGYAKHEEKTAGREPISAKLVANLITVAGADRVMTIDLHAAAIQGFFDIPLDNLMATPILAKYFREKEFPKEHLVIVSPDAGGVARARAFAGRLDASLAIIFKKRPRPDESEVIEIVGEVEGRIAIIMDDLISTGRTLITGTNALMARGAREVYACGTHPVLAGNALELIEESALREVVVTNTIAVPRDHQNGKIKVLSVAPLLGEAIRRISMNLSVSELFV